MVAVVTSPTTAGCSVVANSAVCGLVVLLFFLCWLCSCYVDATSMVWGGVGGDVNVMFMLR